MSSKKRTVEPNLLQKWGKEITVAAGIIIAVGGASSYWFSWGLPVPSTRQYVDWRVDPLKLAQGRYDDFILSFNLQQVDAELTKWLSELPKVGNPQTRQLIEERVKALRSQRENLILQIQQRK